MADELIDIINKNNEVVGQMMKIEAHKVGALHRCVIAQVIDSTGRWLLVQQASDRQDAGQFVSPVGGHVRAGETNDDALRREAMEELGIQVTNFKQIGHAIFNREVIGRKENHYFILYEIYTDDEPVLNHESVEIEKFTKAQLQEELKRNPNKFGAAFFHAVENFYPEFS